MIRKITLILLGCLMVMGTARAQFCGADQIHQERMAADPAYAQQWQAFQTQWAAMQSLNQNALIVNGTGTDLTYEIPVVLHVMHTGGAVGTNYNPSDAQLNALINYLNASYAANWPGYPQAGAGGTFIPLKFVLAKRDPNCNPTTGINRVNASAILGAAYTNEGVNRTGSAGVDDDVMKAAAIWPNNRYYNIWIVNEIDNKDGFPGTIGGFVAGYANYPPGNPATDGTVMLASQAVAGEITLPHELGHGFNIAHTFNGDNAGCPANTNCNTQGDFVCDTEPHEQSQFNCPTFNPCTGTSNPTVVHNFMDYSNCQDRFTPGQRDRMLFALANSRPSLISSSASLPLAPLAAATCVPTNTLPGNTQNAGPRVISVTNATGTFMRVTSSGYNTDGNLVYIDNSCKHQLNVLAGTAYTFSVTTSNAERARIYIDYNNNNTFDLPAEEVTLAPNGAGTNHTLTYTIPVAGVVNCIPLRMRVISQKGTTGPAPCAVMGTNGGQGEDYTIVIKGGGSSTPGAVTIAQTAGGNPSCFNTDLTFQATPGPTVTNPTYTWFINSVNTGVTSNPWMSNTFADGDTVRVRMIYSGLCGLDTSISNFIVIDRVPTVAPTVTMALTAGSNPACPGDSLTFSITNNSNPGGAPVYNWSINGTVFQTGTSPTFKYPVPNNGQVRVQMVSSSTCAVPTTANSNIITVTHAQQAPTIAIGLSIGTNPGCPGQLLTFSVTSVTVAGSNPSFQWRVNGNPVGTNSTVFTSPIPNGAVVTCTMTSSSTCATPSQVTSSGITITHQQQTQDISIAQLTGTNPACQGKPISFQALAVNAGPNPQYQWMKNGAPQPGGNGPVFTTTTLANGDVITCALFSADPCVANPFDTSNQLVMGVIPSVTPSVSASITQGDNPGCLDSLVQFTATATNFGTNPAFLWFVNGSLMAGGPVFTSSTLQNGDVVVCMIHQTDGACYTSDTLLTAPFNMVRSTTPTAPLISFIGNSLVGNNAGSYVWFGPGGELGGQTGQSAHPGGPGVYFARFNNNGCLSAPSNLLTVTLLDVSNVTLEGLTVYPNPTTGQVTLDWGTHSATASITVYNTLGQSLINETVENQSRKTIDLGNLANGMYYIVVKGSEVPSGTVRITLAK